MLYSYRRDVSFIDEASCGTEIEMISFDLQLVLDSLRLHET